MSSANMAAVDAFLSASGMSLIYMTKNIGLRTDPCGMSLVTFLHWEAAESTFTLWVRPVRKLLIQLCRPPLMPYAESLCSRRSWGSLDRLHRLCPLGGGSLSTHQGQITLQGRRPSVDEAILVFAEQTVLVHVICDGFSDKGFHDLT